MKIKNYVIRKENVDLGGLLLIFDIIIKMYVGRLEDFKSIYNNYFKDYWI